MPRPFIPVPDVVSVELIYNSYGVTMENVLHVRLSGPASLSDLQAIRAVFNTWDLNFWQPHRSNATTLVRIRTKALDSLGSPTEDWPVPGGGRPGALTNPMPNNVTFCIRLATGLSGRSFRGRLYTPGIAYGHFTPPGIFSSSEAGALVSVINTLITNLAAATPSATLVVVSYRADKAWRTVGLATPVTTVGYADLNLDSQRRRLPGRGI